MKLKKKQRFYFILLVMGCLAMAAGLSLYALQDNISFFYSPMQVEEFQQASSVRIEVGRRFRLGGLVKKASFQKRKGKVIRFVVTDDVADVQVEYQGLLPDLFREGQGVVATGSLNSQGMFVATEILAKHDENYMPPEVAKSLEAAAKEKRRQ